MKTQEIENSSLFDIHLMNYLFENQKKNSFWIIKFSILKIIKIENNSQNLIQSHVANIDLILWPISALDAKKTKKRVGGRMRLVGVSVAIISPPIRLVQLLRARWVQTEFRSGSHWRAREDRENIRGNQNEMIELGKFEVLTARSGRI